MRVMVAMSGGVDSSVAAALLAREGHDVVGVTMRLWGGESDTGCCSVADVDDARRVAQQLGIDHLVFNFTEDFDAAVVAPYVQAHAEGSTPNPCIECNRSVKFARLAERADVLGFDAVATGHHARIGDRAGRATLLRGADRAKDQSYVVHMLDQAALGRTVFPVGRYAAKAELRAVAHSLGLRTAAKPDSQDVCFITSGGGRRDFLGRRLALHPAAVVDTAGTPRGRVDAVELVTIGQRKGLGLPGGGPKLFVVDVDRRTATVTVGEEPELLRDQVVVRSMTWVDGPVSGDVRVQSSAHGPAHPAIVDAGGGGGGLVVSWPTPRRRVAPGQSVVLYDPTDTFVLGGGVGELSADVLRGRLVTLRPATAADVPALVAIRATPEVQRRWSGADLEEEVAESIDDPDLEYLAVELDGTVVGAIQWSEADDPMYRHAGMDIFLDPAVHGRGVGEDAVRTLARHLVDAVGHHRLVIDPAADNVAAIRCYGKVGFRPVGVMRRYELGDDGEWHDGLLMDLLADELVR